MTNSSKVSTNILGSQKLRSDVITLGEVGRSVRHILMSPFVF